MALNSFHDIVRDHGLFRDLLVAVLRTCLQSLRSREQLIGVDTVLLRAAEHADNLKSLYNFQIDPGKVRAGYDPRSNLDTIFFEPDHFWELYRRIGDEFTLRFESVPLANISFASNRNFHFFLRDIWANYLACEIDGLIHDETKFALLVGRMICYPEQYLDLSDQIDQILRDRYHLGN